MMAGAKRQGGPVIRISKNGPYLVSGGVPLLRETIFCNAKGESVEWREGERYPTGQQYALCRCGGSGNRPFCDGTHLANHFDGTESASRVPYLDRAAWVEGKDIRLSDAPGFCSHARFCVRGKGIWEMVEQQKNAGVREKAIEWIHQCPSGRLVAWDRETGEPLEPDLKPSVGVVDGPSTEESGSLWVRGRIPLRSSRGFTYEVRNRVVLCGCGRSRNKPFCDGSHRER
jgi:CDGSH-type Zn-finger protein